MNKVIFFSLLIFTQVCAIAANIVGVEATMSAKDISAAQTFSIDFKFSIPKPVHIYSSTETEMGQPTTIAITLPAGYVLEKLQFPPTEKFKSFGMEAAGYESDFTATATILAPSIIKNGDEAKISAKISWLACSDQCVPETKDISLKFFEKPSKSSTNAGAANSNAAGDNSFFSILAILASAFLGGAILNLMPCVFPVIGLKIISFAESANNSRGAALAGALFYTIGILASFLALAALLLILRAVGQNLGWGFQLQNPIFTSLMALLFFGMALSFAGVFEIGSGFAGGSADAPKANESKAKKYWAATMSGVVAVLVASPCTAPFMGTAMGAALATDASNALCLGVFASIGLGMATPYIMLSAIPALARMMPRPGAWMDILKQLLSIPLFATVIWLVWVYSKQTDAMNYILAALLMLAIGSRIFGMFYLPQFNFKTRAAAISAYIIFIAGAIYLSAAGAEKSPQEAISTSDSATSENAWSPQKLALLRAEGKIVYVDFTASWCLTCQYNKQILHSAGVEETFKKNNVVVLVGDWTNKNPAITEELAKFGRAGVPLNLVYPAQKERDPIILPAILTSSSVIEAIDKSKQ